MTNPTPSLESAQAAATTALKAAAGALEELSMVDSIASMRLARLVTRAVGLADVAMSNLGENAGEAAAAGVWCALTQRLEDLAAAARDAAEQGWSRAPVC